jgi:hemerythrin HHE cation binding domain-containing protein
MSHSVGWPCQTVMTTPIDAIFAIHNAFRRDMILIDAAALDAARGKPGLAATIERFRFFNEVLEWHAHGEDSVIGPLLESVAPSVYEAYELDHRGLDTAFAALNKAVSLRDPLETARATKAFKFHLDLHLDKEEGHVYRLLQERVSLPDLGQAVGKMGADVPPERFPEVVAWMFPLMSTEDRVSMTLGWKMGMPDQAFAGAVQLIKKALGGEWAELARRLPADPIAVAQSA